ncbi:ribonuclease P protein component [Rubritalea spongiae]|uniref:Ribonuclease P protein component n=1 Tax=Rubritalea spongiae TaxID=430797 RepID=A0ABW5E3W3_9BACT
MRLPRKFSMNHRVEFARVRERGESRPGRYLVVSALPADELKHTKLGLITTKKVGKAHQRNYLRRVFRSIIQKHGELLREDCYIVTIARWRATEASYEELEKEWLKLARKLGLIKPVE